MDRISPLLKYIDKKSAGIEIGPSYNPICAKRDGWNVHTVDHATKAELVQKYEQLKKSNPSLANLDIEKIEEVDFIWRDGSLSALLQGKGLGRVDFIIASHVIEHMPCLISFFRSLEELLKDDGIISLAIPDKRREFDFLKPLSTTGDAIEAWLEKRSRHTASTAFLGYFYNCQCHSMMTWEEMPDIQDITLTHGFDKAKRLFEAITYNDDAPYVDFHAWFFTPASFELLLSELNFLGYTNLLPVEINGTMGYEFCAVLKRSGPLHDRMSAEAFSLKRIELIRKIHAELQEPPPKPHRKRHRKIRRALRKLKNLLIPGSKV